MRSTIRAAGPRGCVSRPVRRARALLANTLEGADHFRAEAAQLPVVRGRQTLDDLLAPGGEAEVNFAAIVEGGFTHDCGPAHELIDDADRAVVADLELLGEVTDGNLATRGASTDGKKGLVLVGSQVLRAKEIFAKAKKSPHLITKCGQGLKI
jgi:hypothetical protein